MQRSSSTIPKTIFIFIGLAPNLAKSFWLNFFCFMSFSSFQIDDDDDDDDDDDEDDDEDDEVKKKVFQKSFL